MEVISKKNDTIKKQILEERKEIIKLNDTLNKQAKKVSIYNSLESNYKDKEKELEYLMNEYSKCEIIEANQKSLISLMNEDVKDRRKNYFQIQSSMNFQKM
jgi:hypothetical protein